MIEIFRFDIRTVSTTVTAEIEMIFHCVSCASNHLSDHKSGGKSGTTRFIKRKTNNNAGKKAPNTRDLLKCPEIEERRFVT
jgi:hypothetical protein